MKVLLKKLLFKVFGTVPALKILNRGYFFLYHTGYLALFPEFRYHYFARKLVSNGDTVVDIGANLGYYSRLFAKWVGPKGKVVSVEPVDIFAGIIRWNTKKYGNVEVLNFALGSEKKEVTLATPDRFGYLRTGLAHIVDDETSGHEYSFRAQMERGSVLLKDLTRLDFIKCDIEGYEGFVLPEIMVLIRKFKPIVQVETAGENRKNLERFFGDMGYSLFELEGGCLLKPELLKGISPGEVLFVPSERMDKIKAYIP